MKFKLLLPALLLFFTFSCDFSANNNSLSPEVTSSDIKTHISWLAADELTGREAGTPEEAKAANYIADYFRDFGLEPSGEGETYFQEFTINMSVLRNPHSTDTSSNAEKRLSKNVIGLLQGTGESDEIIIIGAHYDHLGMGSFGSLNSSDKPTIHNGADDNASGTAGVLELAQYFSENRPKTDLLFMAYSGEEMGLLGSQHFVEHPTVDLKNALAMINMDMIGRMNNKKLMVLGTGTTEAWSSILKKANTDSLNLELVKSGTGSSDHTSFYYKNIPVLHYFTDTHADYHRPSDDTEYINAKGEELALQHLIRVIGDLDNLDKDEFTFTQTSGEQRRSMSLEGPTLGVLPDYGYEGEGMRITGVSENRPAANAGLKGGDVIIGIAGKKLKDIYGYMDALNKLENGQKTTITVLRDGEEMTFDLQL